MARLTYIGNFVPPHSTENHIAATFADLGWQVTWVQQDRAADVWDDVLRAVAGADLVLYTRTHSWGDLPRDRAEALWFGLAKRGIVTATFHLDLFIGLDRERDVARRDPMFTTAHVFTPDGDHDALWRRYGVNHHWLPPAIYRPDARPGAPDPRWAGYDVAFVGSSRRYHHEWPHRQRLIAHLQATYGDRFLLVPRDGIAPVRGDALNDLYATVPVIVGDSLAIRREETRYWSDRVYETVGRGGFLLMPFIEALADELQPDDVPSVDWWTFDDFDSLDVRIDHWLDAFATDPNLRQSITATGSAWVRDHASYHDRVRQMLATIGAGVPA